MNVRSLLLAILFQLLLVPARAGILRHISPAELAGTRDIYHIVRTGDGFLWFCTDNGLFRFDGRHIDRYSTADGLPDNNILNIFEDRSGRLWLFCFNGAPAYLERGHIHTAATDTGLGRWPVLNAYLMQVVESADSALYFGYTSGAVYRLRNGTLSRVPATSGTRTGLSFFSIEAPGPGPATAPRLRVFGADAPFKCWQDYGTTVQADSAGFLVARGGALRRYPLKLQPSAVIHAYLTRDGTLCYGTRRGLMVVDTVRRRSSLLLRNLAVSCIAEDLDGTIWISTLGDGAYQLEAPLLAAGSLAVPKDGRVVRLHDQLLSRGPRGIQLLQEDGSRLRFVPAAELLLRDADPVYLDSAFAVFNDFQRDSTIYVDRITGVRGGHRLKSKAVFRHGNTFFSYGYSRDQFRYLSFGPKGFRTLDSGLLHDYIHAAGQAPGAGAVWFISDDELYRVDLPSAVSTPMRREPLLRDIKRLYPLRCGLLLQTYADKLWMLPADRLSKGRPLPMNSLGVPISDIQLISDSSGLLRTPRGMFYAELQRLEIGLRLLPVANSTSGEELFAWRGRLLRGSPGRLGSYTVYAAPAGRVYLRSLSINGSVYAGDSLRLANTTGLDIQLSVGTIAFGASPLVEYRLNGRSASPWRLLDGEALNLRLAGSGFHEIEFRAVGSGAASSRLRIWASPPFFRSPAFFVMLGILAVLGLLLAAIVVLRSRERSWRKAYAELQLKHQSSNALLNPHFVFNAISNIQGLIHQGDGARAEEYLAELSRMIRQNMENLRHDLIPLDRELQLIEAYVNLQNMRGGVATGCEIRNNVAPGAVVEVPPLILQTFVENAIVHGRCNSEPLRIEISLELSVDGYLIAVIRDNGRGIHEAMKASSWNLQRLHLGICFNRERLHRLNQVYGLSQSVSVTDLAASGARGTEVLVIVSARLHQLFRERAPAADG